MRRQLIIAGALALTTLTGTGAALAGDKANEAAQERAYTKAHRSQAATTQQAATATATARHSGRVIDTHLQTEKRSFVWELVIADGSHRWEVQIDAKNGRVVSDQPDE